MLFQRQQAGATIMFSTHIMSDVEELCQRVALIADSRLLLFGDLYEIKRQRGANSVQVQARSTPGDLVNGKGEVLRNGVVEYAIEDGRTPDAILRSYLDAGIEVERFEMALAVAERHLHRGGVACAGYLLRCGSYLPRSSGVRYVTGVSSSSRYSFSL